MIKDTKFVPSQEHIPSKLFSGELRIPNKILIDAFSKKKVKQLRLFCCAKLVGHRCEVSSLQTSLKIHPRTCKRLIDSLLTDGWAGYDGNYLFPRAWRNLNFSKRGGLYITVAPKNLNQFEALCFAKALKNIYRIAGSPHSNKRRVKPKDFPARYLAKIICVSDRKFERLKAAAQKYRFISVNRQYKIVGKDTEYAMLKKNAHGIPLFKRGKHSVTTEPSKIRVLI